jgi:hypothetical protein
VGAVEAAVPGALLRRVAAADHREGGERDEQQGADQVLGETDEPPVPDQREGEPRVEQRPDRLDDRQRQDDERPERHEVRHAGDAPLEQAPLAEDLDGLDPEPLRQAGQPPGARLPAADELVQEQHAAPGDRQADAHDPQSDDEPDDLVGVHCVSSIVGWPQDVPERASRHARAYARATQSVRRGRLGTYRRVTCAGRSSDHRPQGGEQQRQGQRQRAGPEVGSAVVAAQLSEHPASVTQVAPQRPRSAVVERGTLKVT